MWQSICTVLRVCAGRSSLLIQDDCLSAVQHCASFICTAPDMHCLPTLPQLEAVEVGALWGKALLAAGRGGMAAALCRLTGCRVHRSWQGWSPLQ